MNITRAAQPKNRKAREKARKKAIQSTQKAKKTQKKQLSSEAIVRFERRKSVVESVQRGEPASIVARVHGVSISNVFRWLSWYDSKGMEGLYDNQRTGRPSKVGEDVMRWLYQAITQGDPRQFQFEFALWSLAIIRSLLISEKNLTLDKSTIWRLMKKMGLSPQKPLYQSYRKEPGKVRYYLSKKYPAAEKWAKEHDAEIYFADESRIRVDQHGGTTWAPIGDTPVIQDTGERYGVNMISGISARGNIFFECFDQKMDSDRFIDFLKKLRRSAKRAILVIVDGGSYHTSRAVSSFIEKEGEHRGIKLVQLPPYSPELNPDEQVWNHTKKKVGKMVVKTKAEFKAIVQSVLKELKKCKDLIRSFFQLPDTKYAASY